MPFRPDRERAGFVKVFYRDGGARVLRLNEYEPLTAALRGEAMWYEAEDLYGDPVTIRLAAVVEVALATPASLVAYDADEAERHAHDRATGEA